MADAPDVRVRLSVEGQREIVNALRTVQQQAQQSSLRSGRSFDNLNGVLLRTRSLLASLGAAVSVGALVGMARNAAAAADDLEDAAQSIGTTQERLQGLSVTAALGGVRIDQFRQAFANLSRQIDDLANGSPKAIETFKRLGLSIEDFQGLDAAQALELVAKRLDRYEDGITKAAIASDVFGARLGARLIPVLNQLARQGLEATIDNARELGLVLDDDVVAAAARVNDEFQLMNLQSQNLATSFVAGLSPAVHDFFQAMSVGGPQAAKSWELIGRMIAEVLRPVIALLLRAIDLTLEWFTVTGAALGSGAAAIAHAIRGDFDAARRALENGFTAIQRIRDRAARIRLQRDLALFGPDTLAAKPVEAPGGQPPDSPEAALRRRLELVAAARADELKLTELLNREILAAEKFRYDQGLISLQEFMDSRRRVVQENLQAEIRALNAQRAAAALESDPQKAALATTKIDAEIVRKRLEADGQLSEINRDQQVEEGRLAEQRERHAIEVLELQGETHEARMQQIRLETAAEAKRLEQEGVAEEEIIRLINESQQLKERALAADEAALAVQAELTALAIERAQVEQDIELGTISELEGLQRILALEQARLPILQEAVELALTRAQQSGNPEAIARAEEQAIAIRSIGLAASESQLRLANLREETGDVLEPVVADLLAAEIGARSFGDALAGAFLGAIAAVRRLASELLASRLFELLGFSFAGAGGDSRAAREASGLFAGPLFAEGGPVTGPGTGTSDSILARVSSGEFIVREAIARDPAIRTHLEALNQGIYTPDFRMPPIRAYAEGGAVEGSGIPAGTAPAAGRIDGELTIKLGEGLVAGQLENSSAVARALIRVIGRERHAIRGLLRGNR